LALNLQTFKTRTLTAILFAAVMLVGLLWNLYSFLVLFTIVHFGCWYEFVKLMKKINKSMFLLYSILGLFYITMPILMMLSLGIEIRIHTVNDGVNEVLYLRLVPCAIIFSIWINDTMAYIVGSLIGKTAFSKISPKKTWEGTIGGAILCVVVIASLGYFIPVAKVIAVKYWIAIAAICAVFGTIGDLLESKIKRMADVKDSGSFMPGHGGFLDRFDSLLIATTFVWLYVTLFL
jgi:phosphatidate cytidylyltransferase